MSQLIHGLKKKLFQKSRLSEYSSLLDYALENGYKVTSLSDWYEHGFYPGQKVLVLRHDVDYNPAGAYKMFLIEKEKGVKSTFYFRWSTMKDSVVRKILTDGFEVSLHYETLATYCKKHRIYSKQEVTEDVMIKCKKMLIKEIGKFESLYGKIKTICSHGEIWNMKVGIPNYVILNEEFCLEQGILFETYDQAILSKFSKYISDSSINTNHQWKYGTTPTEAITNHEPSICILTHPHHWDYNILRNFIMVLSYLKIKIKWICSK